MKRIAWAAVMVMMLAAGAYAEEQMGQKPQDQPPPAQQMQTGCRMMGGQGMMGGGMKQGMMGGMMGHHMMMHDSMEVMTGILSIQEKIISGVNTSDKDALLREIARLKGRLEQMHGMCSMQMGMGREPGAESAQPQAVPQKDAPQQHVH